MLILKRVIYKSKFLDFKDFASLVLDTLKEATKNYINELKRMFSKDSYIKALKFHKVRFYFCK
jgi:hypothetical protein